MTEKNGVPGQRASRKEQAEDWECQNAWGSFPKGLGSLTVCGADRPRYREAKGPQMLNPSPWRLCWVMETIPLGTFLFDLCSFLSPKLSALITLCQGLCHVPSGFRVYLKTYEGCIFTVMELAKVLGMTSLESWACCSQEQAEAPQKF